MKAKEKNGRQAITVLVLFILVVQVFSIASMGFSSGFKQEETIKESTENILEGEDEGVEVVAPESKRGQNGDLIEHNFDIVNTGDVNSTYAWSADSGHDWIETKPDYDNFTIQPGEVHELTIHIRIPEEEEGHSIDQLTVESWSEEDVGVSDSDHTQTFVGEVSEVEVSVVDGQNFEVEPGGKVFIDYIVENTGNVNESYDIETFAKNEYWKTGCEVESVQLDIGESKRLTARGMAPNVTTSYEIREKNIHSGATEDIILKATSTTGYTDSAAGQVEVQSVFIADIEFEKREKSIGYLNRREPVLFDAEIHNLANIDDDEEKSKALIEIDNQTPVFTPGFDWDGEIGNWESFTSKNNVTLAGGESQEMLVEVVAPAYSINGTALTDFDVEPFKVNENVEGPEYSNTRNVSVNVLQEGDVVVENRTSEEYIGPAQTVVVDYRITNDGNGLDSFNISAGTMNEWDVDVPVDSVEDINPGESKNVSAEYTAPFKVSSDHVEDVWLEGRSEYEYETHGDSVTDKCYSSLNVTTEYGVDVSIDPSYQRVNPYEWSRYEVIVTNEGNERDNITLTLDYNDEYPHETELEQNNFDLDAFESKTTILYARPTTDGLYNEDYPIYVQGVSESNSLKQDTAVAEISPLKYFDLDVDVDVEELKIEPGKTEEVDMEITSNSNYDDELSFNHDILHSDWELSALDDDTYIEPGETIYVTLEITAPDITDFDNKEELKEANILAGQDVDFHVFIYSSDIDFEPHRVSYDITAAEVYEYRIERKTNPELVRPNDEKTIEVTLHNYGNTEKIREINIEDNAEGRYTDWVEPVGPNEHSAEPLNQTTILIDIRPAIEDEPYLGENVSFEVGVGDFEDSYTNINAEITSIAVDSPYRFGKIGGNITYTLQVMNVPPKEGFEGMGSTSAFFDVVLPSQNNDTEWSYDLTEGGSPTEYHDFDEPYDIHYLELGIDIPHTDLEGEHHIDFQMNNDGYYTDSINLTADVGWYDLEPNIQNIESDERADTVLVEFEITERGYVTGDLNEGVDDSYIPPYQLQVNDEFIPEQDVVHVSTEETDYGKVHQFQTMYSTVGEDWYELEQRFDVELTVNPDGDIHEVNPEGDAEENNIHEKTLTVSRFDFPPNMALLVSIISIAMGISIATKIKRIRSYSLVFLGSLVGFSVGGLYLFPWGALFHTTTVNSIALGLILSGFVGVLVISFVTPFFLSDSLAKLSMLTIPSDYYDDLKEMVSIDDESKQEWDEEESLFKQPITYGYMVISALNGFVGGIIFYTFINVDRFEYVADMIFFELYGLPLIVYPGIIAVLSLISAYLAIKRQKNLWEGVANNQRKFKRIKKNSNTFSKPPTTKGEKSKRGENNE